MFLTGQKYYYFPQTSNSFFKTNSINSIPNPHMIPLKAACIACPLYLMCVCMGSTLPFSTLNSSPQHTPKPRSHGVNRALSWRPGPCITISLSLFERSALAPGTHETHTSMGAFHWVQNADSVYTQWYCMHIPIMYRRTSICNNRLEHLKTPISSWTTLVQTLYKGVVVWSEWESNPYISDCSQVLC